jgi:hypothetical protein
MKYSLNKWYVDQTTRRTKKMVRLGVELEYCEEPKENVNGGLPVGDDDREDEVGYDYNDVYVDEYDKLQRSPLECVPNSEVRKIVRKLGGAMALEVMNEVKRVEAKQRRPMNDYNVWAAPFISSRVAAHAEDKAADLIKIAKWQAIRLRKVEREALFQEWLPTRYLQRLG